MNPEIGVWQPGVLYLKDKQVRSPAAAFEHTDRAQLQCAQSHISGASFDATEKAFWTRLDPNLSGTYAAVSEPVALTKAPLADPFFARFGAGLFLRDDFRRPRRQLRPVR